ncbi:MAG: HEAT repeat domain-containing protein [Planctomycetota bacterium]|jgi:hypothetical protein
MRPVLLILLLVTAPVFADARAKFLEARDALQKVDYEELPASDRDELFAAVAGWDHPDAVRAITDAVSRYGLYLDILESQMRQNQEKLQPLMNKSAMSDQQIGLRNSYLRKQKKLEVAWREANVSLEKLVAAMGAWKEEKSLSLAIAFMPKRPTWRVRQVSALACAHWHKNVAEAKTDKKLFKTLQDLAKDKEPRVRRAVARSLASFRRMEALPVLKKCLHDPDWRVRAAAIDTIKKNPSDETVDMLVMRLPKEKGRLEDDITKFLQELSGEKFQFAEEWVGWWKGKGRRIPPKGATTDPNAREHPDKKKKVGHRFYGIRSRSKGVVYVVDMSGSMKKEVEDLKRGPVTGRKESDTPVGGKTRWEVAANELKRAIRNLNRKTNFTIVFFNHSVQPWKLDMIDASAENKKAAIEFVDKTKPRGATYTLGALRQAFALAGANLGKGSTKRDGPIVDTIFLLSDGGPTDAKMSGAKPMDPDPILDQVRQWNKDLGVVIHTIAVHTDDVGTYFLKQLASQNHGHFVERK